MTDEIQRYEDTYEDSRQEEGVRRRPKNVLHRGSKPVRTYEVDEDGNWRSVIKMVQNSFDDQAKAIFLAEFSKWGRMGDAAAAAGTTVSTAKRHMRDDEEFGEAVMVAEENYKDKLVSHHQDLVFNGTKKKNFDRNGNLVSEETIYPIRLIELELKKHDPGYREKQEVAISHSGGVLVAPAEMESIDDWEKRFNKATDVTPVVSALPAEDEED